MFSYNLFHPLDSKHSNVSQLQLIPWRLTEPENPGLAAVHTGVHVASQNPPAPLVISRTRPHSREPG